MNPPDRHFKPTSRVLVRSTKTPMLFGIGWEIQSPQILNAVLMDVLSYNRVVPTTCRLVVVCSDIEFLNTVASITGVEITSDADMKKQCEIRKLYFQNECPSAPPQGKHVYTKRVGNEDKSVTRLTQGQPGYPSLYNPSDNIVVPPGRSPNINKIPPRYSSNAPQPGLPVQW